MIKFAYTILYVKDVLKSIEFYERAFDFKKKFIVPGNSYGELNTGDTVLSFASHTQANTNFKEGFTESNLSNKPFGLEIGFTTDNVEEVYNHAVKSGAVPIAPPQVKPHGQTVAYVRDPDGFLVEICSIVL